MGLVIRKLSLYFFICFIITMLSNNYVSAATSSLGIRVLLLSPYATSTDANRQLAINVLLSQFVAYDDLVASTLAPSASLVLYDNKNIGLYNAIIMTRWDMVGLNPQTQTYLSTLTDAQRDQLLVYSVKENVRIVSLTSTPSVAQGTQASGAASGVTRSLFLLKSGVGKWINPAMIPEVPITLSSSWTTPAIITDTLNTLPMCTFDVLGSSTAVASVVVGDLQMHFYFTQSPSFLASVFLSQSWFRWVTRGIFIGNTYPSFSISLSEFLGTNFLWNTTSHSTGSQISYRVSAADANWNVSFLESLTSTLPSQSSIKLEMAIVGNGVNTAGGKATDLLYIWSTSNQNRLFWTIQSWDNQVLSSMTEVQAVQNVNLNVAMGESILGGATAAATATNWSPNFMVPEGEIGLDGSAQAGLAGIYDAGVRVVAGDNSFSYLQPENNAPYNPYACYPMTTAKQKNNNLYILPRWATDFYAQSSLIPEEVDEFNTMNRALIGSDYTLSQIISRNVDYALLHIFANRQDPFMFHQANLRTFTWTPDPQNPLITSTDSLFSLFVKEFVARYLLLSKRPLISQTSEMLSLKCQSLASQQACSVTGQLTYDENQNVSIVLKTPGSVACNALISGIYGPTSSGRPSVVGYDITYTIPIPSGGNPVTVSDITVVNPFPVGPPPTPFPTSAPTPTSPSPTSSPTPSRSPTPSPTSSPSSSPTQPSPTVNPSIQPVPTLIPSTRNDFEKSVIPLYNSTVSAIVPNTSNVVRNFNPDESLLLMVPVLSGLGLGLAIIAAAFLFFFIKYSGPPVRGHYHVPSHHDMSIQTDPLFV